MHVILIDYKINEIEPQKLFLTQLFITYIESVVIIIIGSCALGSRVTCP